MKTSIISILFLLVACVVLKAQDLQSTATAQLNQVQSPLFREEILHSAYVDDDFRIIISLPNDYNEQRGEGYPVVYFLDGGETSFHYIAAEYMDAYIIPDVITIGIGYPGASQRNRDYTYAFANFYDFLRFELLPRIDGSYRTDTLKRCLYGHSFGGLCVLQALFKYTDYHEIPFHNLIAASPSIWWPDRRRCFLLEEELSLSTSVLPVNLYMTMGSLEGSMVDDYFQMSNALDSRNYEYFTSSYHLNQNKDHSTNKEYSFREGLKWVLRQKVVLPPEDLSAINGKSSEPVRVFPNPVQDALNIDLGNSGTKPVLISLIDSSGKLIFQDNCSRQSIRMDVSAYPKGLYFLKIDGTDIHTCSKIKVN